jgi:hypothetical protein
MEHGHPETTPGGTPPLDTPCGPPNRGFAVASISLGYFSMVVFFWHPFSTILASVGFVLALLSLIRGVKGGLRGENLAWVGLLICSWSLAIVLTLNQGLRFIMWEH